MNMLPRTKELTRILISGAGGPAAVGAIKSLKMLDADIKIVAVDSDPLSAGSHLAHSFHVVPPADDKSFMLEMIKIITKENIHLIIPTSGFDIIPLSRNKDELNRMEVACFFSDSSVVNLCNNKYEFYKKLKDRYPIPNYSLFVEIEHDYPVFVKPVHGKGSRDSYLCESAEEMLYITARHENMIICEYLPGKEYTIDVLSDLNGEPLCAIPRERIETKAGVSSKGRIERNEDIMNLSMALAEYLELKGPSCMQMKEDKDGKLKFVEVNPRMGGGTVMATLAGVNIPGLILKLFKGETMSDQDLTFKEITVLRYYEEVVRLK